MSFFDEMSDVLSLEFIDDSHAVGKSIDMGWGRIFGGQVLGQTIAMAQHQIKGQRINSIHGHFVQVGDVNIPVKYSRYLLRQGRTYGFYRIEGHQGERLIFHAVVSLQVPEQGVSHQKPAPSVPNPEGLPYYNQVLREKVAGFSEERRSRISARWLERLYQEPPIKVKPIVPGNFLYPDTTVAHRLLWFRSGQQVGERPDLHQRILAWTSDFPMLGTALQPSGIPPVSPQIKMTSLDHTIWFYDDFSVDDWLLMDCYSPVSGGGRGLIFADIFRADGTLVACCSQEGMLRTRKL